MMLAKHGSFARLHVESGKMTTSDGIAGIDESSLELLEAAGFLDVGTLARAGVDELTAELERANTILKIAQRAPSRETVGEWIHKAREVAGMPEESAVPAMMPVDYEQTPQVAAMLAAAPFAIPMPSRILMANQLAVADVPPAILLNRYSGDFDVKTGRNLPGSRVPKAPAVTGAYVRLAESGGQRAEMDIARLRSTGDLGQTLLKEPASKSSPANNERVALIRAPRSATNKGRDPRSRFYIRGVLHNHPISITIGALVTLVLMVMTPLSLVSALLLLLSRETPERFAWVPGWLIFFPLFLPLSGICYLIWGMTASCRICGQRIFKHHHHFKNKRAHHIPGLGYILPLCFHVLLFRWFRCTHCGTPVRLRE